MGNLRVSVTSNTRIGLKNVDRSVDKCVDLILVGARDKAGGIVYTRKLCHPDRKTVSVPVVILYTSSDQIRILHLKITYNVKLDPSGVFLIHMDVHDIRFPRNTFHKRSKPAGFSSLFAHGRTDKNGAGLALGRNQ